MLTFDDLRVLDPWWLHDEWTPDDDPHLASAAAAPFTSMAKAFGRGVLSSRHDLSTERDILTVPVGVLLAAIG